MTKNNQLKTKQILADALLNLLNLKPFSKITVNELCEITMISRSTFYLYFKDKYELLSFYLDKLSNELNDLMRTHSPKDFFIVLLDQCQEKERILYNIFEAERNDELVEMFYQFFSRYFTKYLEEKLAKGVLLPGPVDSLVAFYVGGLTSMTVRWIKSNYKLPKEALASCQYRLLKEFF